jgi:hypothetical protein
MKNFSASILILATTAIASPSDKQEFVIREAADSLGQISTFYVTTDMVAKTPSWSPANKTPAPLSLAEAYHKAQSWMETKVPGGKDYELESCSLQQIINFETPRRWYYTFSFVGKPAPLSTIGPECLVLVLMDGTIIEPRRS